MKKFELDDQGNAHFGPYARRSTAPVTVDFGSADTDGIALDVAATPAGGSERAGIRLGGFVLAQDPSNTGDASTLGVVDVNGGVLTTFNAGLITGGPSSVLWAFAAGMAPHIVTADDGLAVSALGGSASIAELAARANVLKAAMLAHGLSVSTATVPAAHNVADTMTSISEVPAATNVATSCTLLIALGEQMGLHGAQMSELGAIHYYPDATGYTPSSDLLAGNATQANAIVEADAILAALQAHVALSMDTGNYDTTPPYGKTGDIVLTGLGTLSFVNGRLISWNPV